MNVNFTFKLRANRDGITDLCGNALELALGNYPTYTEPSILSLKGRSIGFDSTRRFKIKTATPVLSSALGDFTESFWMKFNTLPTDWCVPAFNGRFGSSELQNFRMQFQGSTVYLYSQLVGLKAIPFNFSTNTWYHVAVTYAAPTMRLFINGSEKISVDMPAEATLYASMANYYFEVGGGSCDRNYFINGYLDDVCAIQGRALWTSNFTPPIAYLELDKKLYIDSNNAVWGYTE